MSAVQSIDTVLVANRGEIAVRIIRTCKKLGLRTVAVYSDADRRAKHVREADEAVGIGPAPSAESYLRVDKIVDAAKASGAQAVHPGYGFLSENAELARACEREGIVFIGPTAEAIAVMGDKASARELVRGLGVPMVAGDKDPASGVDAARETAESIGYPVVIKAVAGGGGKGMRVVRAPEAFAASFEQAQSEARNAFGNDAVYVERYVEQPRHVEIQVLADTHGNVIHLGERECSIQRRHQKIIEEAPSAVLTPELRAEMGAASVRIAQACGYVGVGTVEYLYKDGAYFFLEMNTRLQVEHTVTEMVTGLDLVEQQIRVARGLPLDLRQEDVCLDGHAIQCRIYAEDPAAGYLPDPGDVLYYEEPEGRGVRVDSGVEAGDRVPIHYDPLMSKVCAWGADRAEAIRRMAAALRGYTAAGMSTNRNLCLRIVESPAFAASEFYTSTLDTTTEYVEGEPDAAQVTAAAVAAVLHGEAGAASGDGASGAPPVSRWALRR